MTLTTASSPPIEVIDRFDRFLAVAKPAGRISHGRDGVQEEIRGRFGADWQLVHRLDRETSGVLLLASGAEALRAAGEAWGKTIHKRYLALALGPAPEEEEGEIDAPLLEFHTGRFHLLRRALRAAYGEGRAERLLRGETLEGIPPLPAPGRTALHSAGRPASTAWKRLATRGPLTLLALSPRQGRMHQLRLHVRALGLEIAADRLYGSIPVPTRGELGLASEPDSGEPVVARLALHAERLEWTDPPGGGAHREIVAPLPPEWKAIFPSELARGAGALR